ncbi:hypothetical protein D3C87_77190 [compost metagenome]
MYELTISGLTIKFNFPTDKLEQEIDSIILLSSMFGYKYESFSSFDATIYVDGKPEVIICPSISIELKQRGTPGKFFSIYIYAFDEKCEFKTFNVCANDNKGKKILVKARKEEDVFEVLRQLREFI